MNRRTLRATVGLLALGIVSLLPGAVTAEDEAAERTISEKEALAFDASFYAKDFGVSQEEAERRLALQDDLWAIARRIAAEMPAERYAGEWLEHEPDLRLVVFFTGAPDQSALAKANAIARNAPAPVEIRWGATLSLAELRAKLTSLTPGLWAEAGTASIGISQQHNAILVDVLRSSAVDRGPAELASMLEAQYGIPIKVTLVDAAGADQAGGHQMRLPNDPSKFCTSGFTVRNGSGTRGVVTAGHCQDWLDFGVYSPPSWSWTVAPFQSQRWESYTGYDVQWHTVGATLQARVWAALAYRSITGVRPSSTYNEGAYVCHQGEGSRLAGAGTGGYSCGTVISKEHQPVPNAGYLYVQVAGPSLRCLNMDSGGPWVYGTEAYGIHKAGVDGQWCAFMPIERIATLGLTVFTG